tara:strand:- start:33 stop:737 length:705 start_codon:yes stop_codon:yes gene_type:complete
MAIGNPITLTNNVASKIISVTATADQTLFTVTGGYRINQIAVFRNGARLVDGADFTARDASTVTLITPANNGDTLEFQIFDDFRVADAIVSDASDQTIFGNLTVTGNLNGNVIGIQSTGSVVGTAKTLNFVGSGNTFFDNGNGIIDVTISSGIDTSFVVSVATTTASLKVTSDAVITGVTTSTSFDGNLNASQLNSGTVPDARIPDPLPAVSGANLTNLNIPAGFNELDAALFN